jgi:hypothetical protein|nr:MAG TPA: hypothetical protein [Bacteriophage sp.]
MDEIKKHQKLEPRFGEFPELLFGIYPNDRAYFDVTHFLNTLGWETEPHFTEFSNAFAFWIKLLGKTFGLSREELLFTDTDTGHIMAEESLALLFVVYTDPAFGIYLIESMTQMLLEGFVCSDTYLLTQLRNRFTTEELISTVIPKTV